MEFTKIISSPVFAASAPDIGLEAQSASPVKIVVTTPSASWDITLSPVSDADGKNLLNIRLRDILSAVASAPDPSETEPNSAIPLLMVNLSASNTEGEQASMDIPVAFGTLNGKDPKDFTGQWLTSREQICLTYSWARERLSLIFGPQLLRWSGSVSLTVNCRAYYASGKARNFQLVSAGSSDTVYYSVDCSYSAISALDDSGEQLVAWDLSYTLSGINADGESDSVDSFPQRFILANQDGRIREYIFANCFGMEDRVFGEGVARREVSGSSSTFVNGGKTLEVSNDAEIVYEAFSGQLADRRAVFHWYDFLSSSTRLIFSTADGSMTHIVVESHDSETEDFSVAGVSFSYRLSEKNRVYPEGLCGTIGDYDPNQQCGALWVGDDPQAVTPAEEDLFFLKHRLSEFQTLTASDALLLLAQSPATDAWGSVSLGSIKSWIKKFLDGESREIRLNNLADYETADGKVIDPSKLQNGSIPVWDAAAGAYHPVPASELGDYGINPKLYPLVFQKGKDVVLTYAPNVGKAVLDISDFASAETLSTHISDKDIHVTAEQKSAWDLVASLFGVDEDGNIYVKDNKGFWSNSFISARGSDPEAGSGGGGGGLDVQAMWYALAQPTNEKINASHIPAIGMDKVSGLADALAGKLSGITEEMVTEALGYTPYDAEEISSASVKYAASAGKVAHALSIVAGDVTTVYDGSAAKSVTVPTAVQMALWDKVGGLFDLDADGNVYVKDNRGFYGNSFVSARGSDPEAGSGGGGGGLDVQAMWYALAQPTNEKINASHIPAIGMDKVSGLADALAGKLSGITEEMVTEALGYTPYDAEEISSASVKYAASAGKVAHALSIVAGDVTTVYDGSAAKSVTVPTAVQMALWDKVGGLFDLDADGNVYVKDNRGFYGNSFVSARGGDPGAGSGGGSGVDMESVWYALAQPTTEKINVSHIPALQQLSGTLTNAQLANSSLSVAGVSVALGGAVSTEQIAGALGLGSNAYTSTAYLPLAGGTMTGLLNLKYSRAGLTMLDITNTAGGEVFLRTYSGSTYAGAFTTNHTSYGTAIFNAIAGQLYLGITNSGVPHFQGNTLLHSGNYATLIDSRYVKKSGDTMNGTLTLLCGGDNHDQGIRINRPTLADWATLTIGCVGSGTSGTTANTWLIGTPANSNSLIFCLNAASDQKGLCLRDMTNTGLRWNGYGVWHAGNDGSGSGLDADLLDGYQATSFQFAVSHNYELSLSGGSRGRYVILLHPDTLSSANNSLPVGYSVQGTFHLFRPLGNGTASIIVKSGAGYSSRWNSGSIIAMPDYNCFPSMKLVTCNYGGKLYRALFVDAQQDIVNLYFRGVVMNRDTNFGLAVKYYDYGTSAVTNSEVNGSIADFQRYREILFPQLIEGTITSAQKLATARSIWGQTFDGTKGVDGHLSLGSPDYRLYFGTSGLTPFLTATGGLFQIVSANDSAWKAALVAVNISTGNMGLGTTSPSYKLDVIGTIRATTGIWSNGYVSAKGQDTTSDARYKRDVAALPAQAALAVLMRLRPSTWAWKDDGRRGAGFIAQEVLGVLPEAVREVGGGEDRHLALNYQMLHAYEVSALQTHETELERLRGRVNQLENEIKRIQHGS